MGEGDRGVGCRYHALHWHDHVQVPEVSARFALQQQRPLIVLGRLVKAPTVFSKSMPADAAGRDPILIRPSGGGMSYRLCWRLSQQKHTGTHS